VFRSGLWMPVPDAITSAVRPRRSAKTRQAGGIFQKVVGGGNAGGGFGHRGGDLAGSGDVLRGEDSAELGHQRSDGGVEKRRVEPALSRLTRAAQIGCSAPTQRINVRTPARPRSGP